MAILMDDGSVLPDVAYLTSAQLGRPFRVKWVPVPERDGQTTSVRKQFTNEVTRGKKFEGVYGTDKGVYVVNSFAFNTADLPADAVKHDGMVWFYSYADGTITLVTYFPHQSTSETGAPPRYDGVVFDGPDNVTVTPWGTLVLAEDGVGASHVLSSVPGGPTYAIARNQLNIGTAAKPEYSEFTGSDLLLRRRGVVRERADPRDHARHHRPLGQVPQLTSPAPKSGIRRGRRTRRGSRPLGRSPGSALRRSCGERGPGQRDGSRTTGTAR